MKVKKVYSNIIIYLNMTDIEKLSENMEYFTLNKTKYLITINLI